VVMEEEVRPSMKNEFFVESDEIDEVTEKFVMLDPISEAVEKKPKYEVRERENMRNMQLFIYVIARSQELLGIDKLNKRVKKCVKSAQGYLFCLVLTELSVSHQSLSNHRLSHSSYLT
jgi:hypothetical protein